MFVFKFKKRLFWLQYEEHLEEGKNGSGKSRERLQQSRQEIMNGTLEWSSGGDGQEGMNLRGTCEVKSAGLCVGMEMRAKRQ